MATEKKAQVLQLDPPHELIFKGKPSSLHEEASVFGAIDDVGFPRDTCIILCKLHVKCMYMGVNYVVLAKSSSFYQICICYLNQLLRYLLPQVGHCEHSTLIE